MSKIQTIKITNFKAISEFEADFKGCTAIVTAGNNKGKTSFLRGLPDRIRFIRPDVMVKDGATAGKGEMTLNTGEKFLWEFDKSGKDKLTYISKDNIKQNVTTDLGKRFFPAIFDIDKFLQSTPKEQAKQLQKIIGIDFTEIDTRYQQAYNERTSKNADAEKYHVKLSAMLKVDEVAAVDLTELQSKKELIRQDLNKKYLDNKGKNDVARKEYQQKADEFNKASLLHTTKLTAISNALDTLIANGYTGKDVAKFIDENKIFNLPVPVEPTYIPEMPDDAPMKAIDAEIMAASETNSKAEKYRQYIEHKTATENAKTAADEADSLVKSIEAERNKMIASAKFPKGISITSEGITIDGLPLDKNQISTSKLYTTALRIASMNLGEVKTLYFDASYLDRQSLKEIEDWANENDLQLLIERPDFEGGEIKYELIENSTIAVDQPKQDLFAA